MARCILHVDLDAFFASVEQALDPCLRGKPVVVGGLPHSRGVVACASYEGRALGLRTGMPLTMAYRICPQAVFLPGRFAHYREASERFLRILGDFTPDIECRGIDEAYLDVTGFEELYGPPRQTALRIKARVREEVGITASVGIASSKVVAKVACDLAKPDGLVEVAPGEERDFLAPLAVSQLPCVGSETERALKRMGVLTIGQLAALSLPLLKGLFGAAGEVLHRYARGIDHSPVVALLPPAKSISRSTTFPQDTLDRSFLLAILHYLSERVGAQLRQEGKMARCVVLKLRYADFETITRHRTLAVATDGDETIFATGSELLARALQGSRERVRLLGIGVAGLGGGGSQLSLWEGAPARWQRLYRTIDDIRGRHGFAILQTGRTLLLRHFFSVRDRDYVLKTPALSR